MLTYLQPREDFIFHFQILHFFHLRTLHHSSQSIDASSSSFCSNSAFCSFSSTHHNILHKLMECNASTQNHNYSEAEEEEGTNQSQFLKSSLHLHSLSSFRATIVGNLDQPQRNDNSECTRIKKERIKTKKRRRGSYLSKLQSSKFIESIFDAILFGHDLEKNWWWRVRSITWWLERRHPCSLDLKLEMVKEMWCSTTNRDENAMTMTGGRTRRSSESDFPFFSFCRIDFHPFFVVNATPSWLRPWDFLDKHFSSGVLIRNRFPFLFGFSMCILLGFSMRIGFGAWSPNAFGSIAHTTALTSPYCIAL